MTKRCTKCGEQKLFSEFSKQSSGKYGLRSRCKKCCSAADKKYQQTDRAKLLREKCRKKHQKTFVGYLRIRFNSMKQRCNDPKHRSYKNYGGRGIKCLFKSSQEFIDYIIDKLQIDPHGLQIDRINNNGHYEPDNIRFVTAKVNNNNRRKRKK